jgi:hypothetical protein
MHDVDAVGMVRFDNHFHDRTIEQSASTRGERIHGYIRSITTEWPIDAGEFEKEHAYAILVGDFVHDDATPTTD